MRLQITFILVTVLLDAIGFGLILPVMPDLLIEVQGSNLSHAALWGGVLTTSFAVMQFVFGPLIGGLSDRFGRRPVLLTSLFVMSLDYLVMALAGSIWMLLFGRIVGGITAANGATAHAYIADISKPEEKAANFGLIGAAFGLGFVMGPMIGGLLAEYGTRAPFYAAAVLGALNVLFGWFVLTETVDSRIRRPFSWQRANPFGTFAVLKHSPNLLPLMGVFFLYQVAFNVYPTIWSFFAKERFDWDPGMIGLSLGMFGLTLALVQGVLIRPILRRYGEKGTVLIGLIFDILAFGTLSLLTSGRLAFFFIPIAALAGIVVPALKGMLSQMVSDQQQGELQGALTSVMAISMILSPLIMSSCFAFFSDRSTWYYFPAAPFVMSLFLIVAAVVLFVAKKSRA